MQPATYDRIAVHDEGTPPLAGIQLLDEMQAPPSADLPPPGRILAVDVVRRMRGASQPWLLRCSDGCYYVVKFRNNPQHPRVLANEMLGSRLAQLMGLPVAVPAIIDVPAELVMGTAPLEFEAPGPCERCAPGLQFGSRFPGPPERTLAVEFLPDRLLPRVENLEPLFLGGLVFDKWTCNCDGRQVVFWRSVDDLARGYSGLLIDQGFCFNGGEWNFPDSPIRSLYPRRLVYDSVTGLESFEPFLSRIEGVRPPKIEECIADIPSEWCWPDAGELKPLVSKLYARRRRVNQLIIDLAITLRPFRNWAQCR